MTMKIQTEKKSRQNAKGAGTFDSNAITYKPVLGDSDESCP